MLHYIMSLFNSFNNKLQIAKCCHIKFLRIILNPTCITEIHNLTFLKSVIVVKVKKVQ